MSRVFITVLATACRFLWLDKVDCLEEKSAIDKQSDSIGGKKFVPSLAGVVFLHIDHHACPKLEISVLPFYNFFTAAAVVVSEGLLDHSLYGDTHIHIWSCVCFDTGTNTIFWYGYDMCSTIFLYTSTILYDKTLTVTLILNQSPW